MTKEKTKVIKKQKMKAVDFLEFIRGIFSKKTVKEIDEYCKTHKIIQEGER